jgi:hypothetical protein
VLPGGSESSAAMWLRSLFRMVRKRKNTMAAIMARPRIPPTTPPAMAPAFEEDAGIGFGVGVGVGVSDIDVVVEEDVVVLEEVEVLEDCRSNSLELRVVVRLIKLDVAVAVGAVAVERVAALVTNEVAVLITKEVAAVLVTGTVTSP